MPRKYSIDFLKEVRRYAEEGHCGNVEAEAG